MYCYVEGDAFQIKFVLCAARQLEREQRKAEMRSTLLEIAKTLSTRQDRGEAVFKPSHILPTYTVEQAGLIELEEVGSAFEPTVV